MLYQTAEEKGQRINLYRNYQSLVSVPSEYYHKIVVYRHCFALPWCD